MKKALKITIGIVSIITIVIAIILTGKQNPRVYLSDKINLAYINEDINHKNFDGIFEVLKSANVEVDQKIKENISYLQGIYILSDSNLISDKKSSVAIIDFGYLYPVFMLKIENYFDKLNDLYVLKEEYREKYFGNEKIYLKIEKGNFLIAKKEKDIERVIKNERYFNQNILKILDRERNNNLGMIVANLGKNPLGGFDELVLTGNINKNSEATITVNIGGKNDIIKNFNNIKTDGLYGERVIEKNKLYLRTSRDSELRSFIFFLNYFLKNSIMDGISSKVYINTEVDKIDKNKVDGENFKNVSFEKNQFIYGDIDIDIKDKDIGNIELKGLAEENRLKIMTILNKGIIVNLLNAIK